MSNKQEATYGPIVEAVAASTVGAAESFETGVTVGELSRFASEWQHAVDAGASQAFIMAVRIQGREPVALKLSTLTGAVTILHEQHARLARLEQAALSIHQLVGELKQRVEQDTAQAEGLRQIAVLLGKADDDWSSPADYLEDIADIVGRAGLPHPGSSESTAHYRELAGLPLHDEDEEAAL